MSHYPNILLIIGFIFILGLAADILGRKTSIPRVTFLILLGIFLGPSGINALPQEFITKWFPNITTIALGMIGFLLGQQFTLKAIKHTSWVVFSIAFGKVIVSFVLISTVLTLIGIPLFASLIIGSIASATAPAVIFETISEMKISTPFTKTLLGVVALDDILALLLFSLVLAFVSVGEQSISIATLFTGFSEVVLSIVVGYLVGYPIAKLTGRITDGEPMMAEALGSVFLVSGIAIYFDLSTVLVAMAMGSAVKTFAKHHTTPFHIIKDVKWPFMIIFFILAGASLHLDALLNIGFIGIVYIIARISGFYLGTLIAGRVSGASKKIQKWMGFALIPQAGVAIGMALMASQRYEEYSHLILPIILGTTVFFELIGPIATKYVIQKSSNI